MLQRLLGLGCMVLSLGYGPADIDNVTSVQTALP